MTITSACASCGADLETLTCPKCGHHHNLSLCRVPGRTRYVWRTGIDGRGHWWPIDRDAPLPPRKTPYVVRDISDYRSVVTGEVITGRAQHREHLKMHGCIEVGNEPLETRYEPLPPIAEDIERAIQASPETHAEARAALERATQAVEE
jgi:hypothetical protein